MCGRVRAARAAVLHARLRTCRARRYDRAMRLAAILTVATAALLSACDGGSAAPKLTEAVAFTLSVKGMHCEGCEGAICGKVGQIAGVTACKASHMSEQVEVIAPAEQKAAITAAIVKLGYKVE